MSDYDYAAFCRALSARDGLECRVRLILAQRRPVVPSGLLTCESPPAPYAVYDVAAGLGLDGHHLVPKQRIKDRAGKAKLITINATGDELAETGAEYIMVDLRDALEDPRNGILGCRRHHDLLERRLIRLFREDLPDGCTEFAEELGLGWSVERDYAPRPSAGTREDRYTNTEADAAEYERMRETP